MCGRFSLELDDTFYPRYEVENIIEIAPNYNVAPSSFIPVVVKNSPKKVVMMKWGFKVGKDFTVINTRAETISTKSAFKNAFQNNRCLIPATGFYEWRVIGKEKHPYYIHLKDHSYFSFAGIYTDNTCSIITTTPNELMSPIHDRMPVILSNDEEEIWVDKSADEELLKTFLDPYTSEDMEAYMISKDVNSPRNNSKNLQSPL